MCIYTHTLVMIISNIKMQQFIEAQTQAIVEGSNPYALCVLQRQ